MMPSGSDARQLPPRNGFWRRLLSLGHAKDYISAKILSLKVSSRWDPVARDRFQRRHYSSYDAYVSHQRAKLGRVDLTSYDEVYRRVLAERLGSIPGMQRGTTVLCLAARLGTEVKAFLDHGCFALGIDLNPGALNRYVVHGDFHDLQFAAASTDVVFTNSLDHCFDIQRVLDEVRRVLKPRGLFIVEAVRGADEGCRPLFYESFSWATVDDLVTFMRDQDAPFECVLRAPFTTPWPGEQLCFRPVARSPGSPAVDAHTP
jgi:SAM-dependent methyltransferase